MSMNVQNQIFNTENVYGKYFNQTWKLLRNQHPDIKMDLDNVKLYSTDIADLNTRSRDFNSILDSDFKPNVKRQPNPMGNANHPNRIDDDLEKKLNDVDFYFFNSGKITQNGVDENALDILEFRLTVQFGELEKISITLRDTTFFGSGTLHQKAMSNLFTNSVDILTPEGCAPEYNAKLVKKGIMNNYFGNTNNVKIFIKILHRLCNFNFQREEESTIEHPFETPALDVFYPIPSFLSKVLTNNEEYPYIIDA